MRGAEVSLAKNRVMHGSGRGVRELTVESPRQVGICQLVRGGTLGGATRPQTSGPKRSGAVVPHNLIVDDARGSRRS